MNEEDTASSACKQRATARPVDESAPAVAAYPWVCRNISLSVCLSRGLWEDLIERLEATARGSAVYRPHVSVSLSLSLEEVSPLWEADSERERESEILSLLHPAFSVLPSPFFSRWGGVRGLGATSGSPAPSETARRRKQSYPSSCMCTYLSKTFHAFEEKKKDTRRGRSRGISVPLPFFFSGVRTPQVGARCRSCAWDFSCVHACGTNWQFFCSDVSGGQKVS